MHRNIWNSISKRLNFFHVKVNENLLMRKNLQFLATWGSASTLLILSLIDRPSTFIAVLLFILTVSMMAALFNGYGTNSIDLSPNFCGTLQGIVSAAGVVAVILGSLCVGWLVKDPVCIYLLKIISILFLFLELIHDFVA